MHPCKPTAPPTGMYSSTAAQHMGTLAPEGWCCTSSPDPLVRIMGSAPDAPPPPPPAPPAWGACSAAAALIAALTAVWDRMPAGGRGGSSSSSGVGQRQ